ncbi:MAG: membrane dipeptidase [Bacteroidales bacterium]|jgi:microsomal dipeptidase-like Zn-dependent dipeptidase/gamma-glutamyl-gamma-aminobutyrate hydrolase PuuD|nr:membrane dipeptidase [Bacteroidales bacterium]
MISVITGVSADGQERPCLTRLNAAADAAAEFRPMPAPMIGISASHYSYGSGVADPYIQSVADAGGIPLIIPVTESAAQLAAALEAIDGLVLIGGGDADPRYYGEEPLPDVNSIDPLRDRCDLQLIRLAASRNIPILGICRGEQMINVAFGGTLYQDIDMQHPNAQPHRQTAGRTEASHEVTIAPHSKLAEIIGSNKLMTNSFHHQAVKEVAPEFSVTATAADGIIEAIEACPNRSIVAVQWHPEEFAAAGDTTMLRLFRYVVEAAQTFRHAKILHRKIFTVDTHCDTPLEFMDTFDIGRREPNQVSLPKMREGHLDAAFFIAFLEQEARDEASLRRVVKKTDSIIDGIYRQVEKNREQCGLARTATDLQHLKQDGKKAIFIGIENGYGIGKDLANLKHFKERGVSYMTLCHVLDNDLCDSSSPDSRHEWNGLSPFGRKAVKEMNRLGIMVDVSHVSEQTFNDVLKVSKKPVIASHSSVKALCNHDRNLTDEQLHAIARKGGVVQICLVDEFINSDVKNASLTDAVRHIIHAVEVAGIDHVGIASDFDGGGGVIGCRGSNDLINITVKLLEKGFSDDDIAKIWGGNIMRVLTEVQK